MVAINGEIAVVGVKKRSAGAKIAYLRGVWSRWIKIVRAIAFLLVSSIGMMSASAEPKLLTGDEAFSLSVERNASGRVILNWRIAEGYYLYRDHIVVSERSDGSLVEVDLPKGVQKNDPNFGAVEIYHEQVSAIVGPVVGQGLQIRYQGCKENSICYPPITKGLDVKSLALTSIAPGMSGPSEARVSRMQEEAVAIRLAEDTGAQLIPSLLKRGGSIWVLISFLVFGLLLAFTPCVLPMYPILVAALGRSGENLSAGHGFALSLTYVVAMASAFGLLGGVAAWSGRNLQIVLQSPYAVAIVAGVFAVLAASMFDLFELQLPSAWMNRLSEFRGRPSGSFGSAAFLGFTSALIVGPCVTAPLAGALLYIAQTGDMHLGATALFAMGLGQGIPLVAFGTLGSSVFPKRGKWMAYFKHAFGIIFLGISIWMLSRVLEASVSLAFWAALSIVAGVFLGGFDTTDIGAGGWQRVRKASGLILALYGVVLGIGAAAGEADPLAPLQFLSKGQQQSNVDTVKFLDVTSPEDLKEKLAASFSSGRPALVYFTADWCVTCKAIEQDVLSASEVKDAVLDFARIRVDLSRLTDLNQALLRDFEVVGPPTMVFLKPTAVEAPGSRLIGEISKQSVLSSLQRGRR